MHADSFGFKGGEISVFGTFAFSGGKWNLACGAQSSGKLTVPLSLDNRQNESWVDYPEQQGFSLFMKEHIFFVFRLEAEINLKQPERLKAKSNINTEVFLCEQTI